MRTDAKRNLKKVATEVLKDPLQTEREIAKKAGVSNGTAHNMLSKIEQNIDRTSTIVSIEESDLEIVVLSQSIILDKMRDEKTRSKMGIGEISQVAERSQKRYSFLTGENANEKGGERKVEVIHYGNTTSS